MRLNHARHGLAVLGALGLLAAGCGKKDKNSDTPPGDNKAAGKLELMPAIDVSCGGSNCFDKSQAKLELGSGESFLQSMQMMVWIVVGFPANSPVYDSFSDAQKAVVPRDGQAGRIESVRKAVAAAALAHYVGDKALANCAAAPVSGSFPVDGSVATWTTPKLSAPAGYKWAGKYEKALTATFGSVDYRFEFNCDKPSMVIASKEGDKNWQAFFYEVDEDKVTKAEFDMFDSSGAISDAAMSIQFMMTKNAANDVRAWVSRTGPKDKDDTYHLGYRYVVAKAGASDKVSFFNASAGDSDSGPFSHIATADWNALPRVTDDAVVATAGADEVSQGCASDWNAARETLTMDTLCEGLTLDKAPKSGLDADGNASLKWVDANLKAKLSAIF